MGVSTNWLKKCIDYKWSAEELAEALTMAGIAIEVLMMLMETRCWISI